MKIYSFLLNFTSALCKIGIKPSVISYIVVNSQIVNESVKIILVKLCFQ